MAAALRGWARSSSTASKLATVEQIIGYRFNSVERLYEALDQEKPISTGPGGEQILGKRTRNTRLALVGDNAAKLNFSRQWYDRNLDGWHFSRIVGPGLSNDNFSRIGFAIGLDKLTVPVTTDDPYSVASTIEAILGAVQYDGGEEAVARVMSRLGITHKLLVTPERLWVLEAVKSKRSLPDRFFLGHQWGLQGLLMNANPGLLPRNASGNITSLPLNEASLEPQANEASLEPQANEASLEPQANAASRQVTSHAEGLLSARALRADSMRRARVNKANLKREKELEAVAASLLADSREGDAKLPNEPEEELNAGGKSVIMETATESRTETGRDALDEIETRAATVAAPVNDSQGAAETSYDTQLSQIEHPPTTGHDTVTQGRRPRSQQRRLEIKLRSLKLEKDELRKQKVAHGRDRTKPPEDLVKRLSDIDCQLVAMRSSLKTMTRANTRRKLLAGDMPMGGT